MTDVSVEVPMEYRQDLELYFSEMQRLGDAIQADRQAILQLRKQSADLKRETDNLHLEFEQLAAAGRKLKAESDSALARLSGTS